MSILKYVGCTSLSMVCLLVAVAAHADAALRPVPVPDLSKLAPDAAKQLASRRAAIDEVKAGLVGPPLAQAYADLGALYARNGFDAAAAIAFYDASQISPSDARWYYLSGVIARKLKRNDDAKADFQAALDHDKIYLPIRFRLADTLIDLNDLAGARKVLDDAAHEHSDQAVIFAMLGRLALQQKRYADAVADINTALRLDPKANELYAHLADAYAGQGNAKAAEEARAKAGNVMTELNDPLVAGMYASPPPQASGTPFEQAQTFARQGRIAAARAKLSEIFEKDPNDTNALALSARIEASLGNQLIAQIEIDQALKLKQDSAIVYLTSGMVAEYGGDDKKSYDDYRQAQRLDRKQVDTFLLLGNAEMRRQRYAQAVEQYRGLVELQPDSGVAYAHLVAALVAQRKCDDALEAVSGALAKNKDNGDLMELFARVASTCPDATSKQRDTALDYAQALYKQLPDASNSSALALALAAHGKFKEAQEYQAQAIFESVRANDSQTAAGLRSTMALFAKQQVPDRPWPVDHAYFKPPMLAAARAPAPAATKPK